jgi:hypothetical protein
MKKVILEFTEEEYARLCDMYTYAHAKGLATETSVEGYLQRCVVEAAKSAGALRGKTFTCI